MYVCLSCKIDLDGNKDVIVMYQEGKEHIILQGTVFLCEGCGLKLRELLPHLVQAHYMCDRTDILKPHKKDVDIESD